MSWKECQGVCVCMKGRQRERKGKKRDKEMERHCEERESVTEEE
jgi:hypothetical protein